MKNIFFSILVLFMLAFSILGNINIADAESTNIVMSDINAITAIKGVDNSVQVSFDVRNIDPAIDLTVNIVSTDPETSDRMNILNIVNNSIRNNLVLVHMDPALPITFSVPIPANVVTGVYTGKLKVTEIGPVPIDNFIEKTYTINVQDSNPVITITGLNENNELVITSEEDNVKTKQFTIQNSGNIALNDLKLTIRDGTFTDGTETIGLKVKFGDEANFRDVILGTPIDIQDLASGSSLLVTLESRIPSDIELDIYSGNIVIADSLRAQATSTIPLIIKIEPEICSDGRVSDGVSVDGPKSGDLRITIDNPDDGDDFNILDEISIEGDVENKGNEDLDVVVEAMLYDLDDNNKILSVESDSIAVDKSEQESYDLTMIIPNDQDIDPDHVYILYVKASDDGDEDQYCNYDSIEVNLDRENDYVIVNSFTINPTVVQQGSVVSFTVGVENIGTDDQKDAYIKIKSTDTGLGLDLTSNKFNLKKYDKSENDQTETFTFTVPRDAEAKEYTIEAIVYFDNEKESNNAVGKLTVNAKTTIPGETDSDNDGLLDSWEITNFGDLNSLPSDDPDNDGLSNLQEFKGNTNPLIKATAPGTYTPTGTSIFSNLGDTKTLFIIGDIVLVVLAVLFLVLIFKRK